MDYNVSLFLIRFLLIFNANNQWSSFNLLDLAIFYLKLRYKKIHLGEQEKAIKTGRDPIKLK